jgi:predicted nucleic acid-binding protein
LSHYYLDASALIKRSADEVGSDWLRALVAPDRDPVLFISRMTIVEAISAFARRLREGSLAPPDFALVRDTFRGDCLDQYQVMPPTTVVIDMACDLLERHPLRAYDALQLATALRAQRFLDAERYSPLTFLSADDRLNGAATAEGLAVDDPTQHP